jgi:hypothetical protein
MPHTNDRTAKMPYETPKLLVFGDLSEITKNSGSSKTGDNGAAMNNGKSA